MPRSAVPELIENRVEGLVALRATVRAERLTSEELLIWMRVVNDMRLVLGTVIGINEDGVRPEVRDELVDTVDVYEFLGYVLELIVERVGVLRPAHRRLLEAPTLWLRRSVLLC